MCNADICAPQLLSQSSSGTDLHSILFQALPQSIMSSLPILLICMNQLVRPFSMIVGWTQSTSSSAGRHAAALLPLEVHT